MNKKSEKHPIQVTEKGSLGLLALGDIGLRAWREVKKVAQQKRENEKEK